MQRTALAMYSGGLDSALAIRIIKEQGVKVVAFHFVTLFTRSTLTGEVHPDIVAGAEELSVELLTEDATDALLGLVRNPPHGHGKHRNPCIDCRINGMHLAEKCRKRIGADFLITGEVLGQRPMSQNRGALDETVKVAGLEDILLRPLCAKLLEPTLPEREGWVDREELLGIKGRSRREQLALAEKFCLEKYGTPAGGCLLCDAQYCVRVDDLIEHVEAPTRADLALLRVGRHFRATPDAKLISGRTHEENLALAELADPGDLCAQTTSCPGSIVLLRGESNEETRRLAAALAVWYSKTKGQALEDVCLWRAGDEPESGEALSQVEAIAPASIHPLIIPQRSRSS